MTDVLQGPTVTAKFCVDCGASLADGTRFCTNCGKPTNPDAVQALSSGFGCRVCGGDGRRLRQSEVFCPECRWLRPLGPGYEMPVEAFMYSLDAQAMGVLASIGPLRSAAHALSERIGRPWLESAVNGIRLGPDQLPDIFNRAVLAARIVGLGFMPELYISGEQMWDAMTLGSETSAFIVVGSVLNNFKDKDLLYVLGREMGHCKAGHAMWRTVMQFMSGKRSYNKNLMGEGILQYLNPSKIVESAIDAPLMAWARHSEITADRAGALVVRRADVIQRVATQWALRSFPLYAALNLDALERQIAESENTTTQMAEMTMTSTPYLAGRLRQMRAFMTSAEFQGWRDVIDHWVEPSKPTATPAEDMVRVNCIACHTPIRFPRRLFGDSGEAIKVRCPAETCGKVIEIKPLPPKQVQVERIARDRDLDSVRLTCVKCKQPFRAPKAALVGKAEVHVRCANAKCGAILTLRPQGAAAPSPAPPAPAPGSSAAQTAAAVQAQPPEALTTDQ